MNIKKKEIQLFEVTDGNKIKTINEIPLCDEYARTKVEEISTELELDKTEEEAFDDLLLEGLLVNAAVLDDDKYLVSEDNKILIL